MNDIDIFSLDEATCKAILDALAKKAYGPTSYVNFLNAAVMVNIKNENYFLLMYNSMTGRRVKSISYYNGINWKNVLNDFKQNADDGMFISYLPNRAHLIDSSISIEEIIISLELNDHD